MIVIVLDWLMMGSVFTVGCCVGGFLNVLIYRFPREIPLKPLRSPCPACGEPMRLIDHISTLSWLLRKPKCRHCRAPVRIRNTVIELLTAVMFLGMFLTYFHTGQIQSMPPLEEMGWLIYLTHITLLSALILSSAIDLEFWIIPLAICWFVTTSALIFVVA